MLRVLRAALISGLLLISSAVTASAAPLRTGGLSGVIYSHNGSGAVVAHAKVTAYALPGLQAGCDQAGGQYRPVASTTTGSTGAYTLRVPAGHYRLEVVPPDLQTESFGYRLWPAGSAPQPNVTSWIGYAQEVLVPTNGVSNIDVMLAAPGTITGTATLQGDPATKLAGILVQAFAGDGGMGNEAQNFYYQPSGYVPSAVTGADGSYTIRGLPLGVPDPVSTPLNNTNNAENYMVTMTDPSGWHESWISPLGPFANIGGGTATVDGTLRATPRITGQVVNEKHRPLAGISVMPSGKAYAMPSVTTDSKGRFTIANFTDSEHGINVYLNFTDPKGIYKSVWYPGYENQAETDPVLNSTSDLAITQVMVSGAATVTGTIWYGTQNPGSGMLVSSYGDGHGANEPDPGMWQTGYTAAACDGTFRLTGLWPGTHTLYYSPPLTGQDWMYLAIVTSSAGSTTALATLQAPTWTIAGQLQQPIPGVEVSLYSYEQGYPWTGPEELIDWAATGAPSARTYTDDQGRFWMSVPLSYSLEPGYLAITGATDYYDTWYGYLGPFPIADTDFYNPTWVPWNASGVSSNGPPELGPIPLTHK